MNPRNFFSELKRRNVYKVAIAYGVSGWAIAEGISQIFPVFDIPNWAVRLIVLLIIVGFPFVLIMAWAFEITPEGIKRTEIADAEHLPQRRHKRAWIYIVAIGGVVATGLFFAGRFTASRSASGESGRAPSTMASLPVKSIAVLPFDNLSRDPDNAYFAEGMQNEILTRLAAVRDLKVISRTSTTKYQSKPDNLKTVAQELGVSTIIEGAVQKAGDKVQVNVQLIDAHTDTHLWAKSYDRDLKDVLEVESEVSREIADALKANLSPGESHALSSTRTPDTEAYDLFLKGEYEFHQAENIPTAVDAYDRADAFYRQALACDPNFVEAAAELARNRLLRHWFVSPMTPPELEGLKSRSSTTLWRWLQIRRKRT